MPLLKNGRLAEDAWAFAPDDADLAVGGCITVSLSRFLAETDALTARNEGIGVRLAPADDPSLLSDHLDRLQLIEVEFPKYVDGRGYSIAQLLRRRLGYSGELRAVGQVLRDQLAYMTRCGFDALMFETSDAEAGYAAALAEFSEAYQATADGRATVFEKRARASRTAEDQS
ncbi:MAG: DUF934 domain-containing protein [Hyphomonadaceae bacterium]